MQDRHTISCLVENHFGVLSRVAGLISARGFNIDSLTVSVTEDPTISRMTIVVIADKQTLEQVKRQLNRLIDVIEVQELKPGAFIDRELLLVHVTTQGASKQTVQDVVAHFGARIIDWKDQFVVIEATGDSTHMDNLVDKLRPLGIRKLARTGRVALDQA